MTKFLLRSWLGRLSIFVAGAGLAACSSNTWVPDFVSTADWFSRENQIAVTEIFNSSQCNAPDEHMRVTALAGGAAVKIWERQRGVSVTGLADVPSGQFAVVDLGQPRAAGHGLAVSRVGGLKDDILVLKVTLFSPTEADRLLPALNSPCALVRLPDVPFVEIRVVDQEGKMRASGAGLAH